MLRVLKNAGLFPQLLHTARALAPFWRVLSIRSMARGSAGDEGDEVAPEGRRTGLRRRAGPTDNLPVRSYLDVIKYVPVSDHYQLIAAQSLVALAKSEYNVRNPGHTHDRNCWTTSTRARSSMWPPAWSRTSRFSSATFVPPR